MTSNRVSLRTSSLVSGETASDATSVLLSPTSASQRDRQRQRPSINNTSQTTVRVSNQQSKHKGKASRASNDHSLEQARPGRLQQPINRDPSVLDGLMDEEGVSCCTCGRRPRQRDRKYRRRSAASWISQRIRNRRGSNQNSNVSLASSRNEFFDASQASVGNFYNANNYDDEDSLHFFDAEQEPLGDDEYPIVFLTDAPPSKPYVTFREPVTMLAPDEPMRAVYEADISHSADDDGSTKKVSALKGREEKINDRNHADNDHDKRLSRRLLAIIRRPTLEHKQTLQNPRIVIPIKGYPGSLSAHELALAERFIREIRLRPPEVAEQVFSLRDIEDEPYAICRWLRATKYDVDAILQRLEDNIDAWNHAKARDFYPNPNTAIGAPFSVFLTQYPFLSIGRAKNGCPVNYFQCGKIRPEGILCLTTLKHMENFFWFQFVHKFKVALARAQEINPNVVRTEGINVLDLSNLSTSALTSETTDVIKLASKISDFFPETLHCMLLLNAPSFFAISWSVIRKFIDPRTAARIQVFSSQRKGLARLRELVDQSEIPEDYGGDGLSINEVLLREAASTSTHGSPLRRQEYELLHIKKRGSHNKHSFILTKGETMELRIYTRSVTSAKFTLKHYPTISGTPNVADAKILKQVLVRGNLGGDHDHSTSGDTAGSANTSRSHDAVVTPKEKLVIANVKGPGTIVVEGVDQDDCHHHKYSSNSRGYFLVVANIF